MRTILLAIVIAVVTSACATSGGKSASAGARAERAAARAKPPQLWSDHKLLQISVGACAERAFNVLRTLGYADVVRNNDFSYGNFNENRAAVKCVARPGGSFLYFAVAGPDRGEVERLRNDIAWKF